MRAKLLCIAGLILAGCATQVKDEPAAQPAASSPARAPAAAAPSPQTFAVMLAPGTDPKSGRLIVIATPEASWRAPTGPNADPLGRPRFMSPGTASYVAAQEATVTSAEPVRFDADMLAYPEPLSRIKPGEYWMQVRLDIDHDAAYGSIIDGSDFTSIPVKMALPTAAPVDVTLLPDTDVVTPETAGRPRPVDTAPSCNGRRVSPLSPRSDADDHIRLLDFISPSLTEFWGRPTHICALVLLPPDYEATGERYPTVYRTEGFGATLTGQSSSARRHYALMKNGDTPPMIRVFLDHSSPWGTHEFADSVNNGPWGQALTEELIPWLETQYKMDGEPSGRFVTGHSSGGWFAMWQIVRYPEFYGGSWARAPDPVDFRSFTGIDIYRPGANAYVRPDGSEQYLVRDATGKETTSFRQYALQESVLGDFGGQIDSFDWVFSPRGNDGRPQPLFDRATGAVDPEVADYWRTNYDISAIIRRDWVSLKQVLDGKIHLIMGTMDTFHLNEAAVLLEQELKALGAKAEFTWMEGRTHGNLDSRDGDPNWLEKKIAWEMYAVARPKGQLKPKPYVPPAP